VNLSAVGKKYSLSSAFIISCKNEHTAVCDSPLERDKKLKGALHSGYSMPYLVLNLNNLPSLIHNLFTL
jgi:hypothetical protein